MYEELVAIVRRAIPRAVVSVEGRDEYKITFPSTKMGAQRVLNQIKEMSVVLDATLVDIFG